MGAIVTLLREVTSLEFRPLLRPDERAGHPTMNFEMVPEAQEKEEKRCYRLPV